MLSIALMTSWDGRLPGDLEFPARSDETLGVLALESSPCQCLHKRSENDASMDVVRLLGLV